MTVRILTGDALEQLRSLDDDSVDMVCTSPPYYALRSYLPDGHADKAREIGLEESPAEFVERLVAVFREVRRVLKRSGTLWLNLGDSYAGSWGAQGKRVTPGEISRNSIVNHPKRGRQTGAIREAGLKPKDMIGIPWRVAFALQADGWWLRQDIIWHKPNPLPESIRDRCTKAHEYVFLFSKARRYHFDADAISEPCSPGTHARVAQNVAEQIGSSRTHGGQKTMKAVVKAPKTAANAKGSRNNESFNNATAGLVVDRRNKRSVWTIGTEPFPEAHFATFPPALVEPCILAGCPSGGVVLDPFGGAGTTGLVASRLGRSAILIELNPEYATLADRRLRAGLAQVEGPPAAAPDGLPLFGGVAA
jgi:DNA modification methylase